MERRGRAGRTIERVVALEDQADHGDLYTTSLRGSPRTIPLVAPGLVARGPLRGSVAFEAAISGVVHGRVTLALDAGVPFLRVLVQGENQDVDHRVRLVFGGDVEGIEVWADAAFGPVRRTPIDAPREDCLAETPPATAPLHRYVSRFAGARGLTIYSDGLAEYEAMRDGRTAVTLVRAVGELSRDDLPDRPGHAGWPAPTPLAQILGPFRGCFALAPHGARDAASVDAIERLADDVLLPLRGGTLRSALAIPAPTTGIELEGRGLAFAACKPAERDGWITLRAVNLLDTAATGRWRFGRAPREAVLARLDETPLAPLPVLDDGIAFEAGPRGTVTVLVR